MLEFIRDTALAAILLFTGWVFVFAMFAVEPLMLWSRV